MAAEVRARLMASRRPSIEEPDTRGLRHFGLVTGTLIAGLFGLLLPWLLGLAGSLWPWLVGAVLVLWAWWAPASLRPVYRGWMRLALLLSRITTPLILGAVFIVLFVPMALVMKLIGRDAMARRFRPSLRSYRLPSRKPSRQDMEKPY